MPVLVTGIHVFLHPTKDVGGRNKSGHDEKGYCETAYSPSPSAIASARRWLAIIDVRNRNCRARS